MVDRELRTVCPRAGEDHPGEPPAQSASGGSVSGLLPRQPGKRSKNTDTADPRRLQEAQHDSRRWRLKILMMVITAFYWQGIIKMAGVIHMATGAKICDSVLTRIDGVLILTSTMRTAN